jgi:hypothetical protein
MTSSTNAFAVLALAFAPGPDAAVAAPVQDPDSGRYYEVKAADDISWSTANSTANGLTHNAGSTGLQGHLATITSAGEDAFIHALRMQAALARPEAWVGGFQLANSTQPDGGWTWINGEGVIPMGQSSVPYSNWLPGEPNNLGGKESHLAVGLGNAQGWNDEGARGNIGGYIVEYRVVLSANDDGPVDASSGVPKNIDVLVNDSVSAAVASVSIESPPASGGTSSAVVQPDFSVKYTSDTAFEGTDTFEYRVTDVNGAYAIAIVTVQVSASEASVEVGIDQLIFNQALNPSPDANNPMTAAYQQVLDDGKVTISCCRVLDTREGAGKKGSYNAAVFDLGRAVADTVTNPGCAGMPAIPANKAKLRPWQRGVPLSQGIVDPGDPPPADVREHDLGVCLIEANVPSRGVVFSAEEAKNVLGYRLNGAVETIRYRPFTGGVSIDPVEVDKAFVTPWTAEWDESRSGKRFSDNVMVVNLWHEWSLLPSVPYLVQLASSLDASIRQVKAEGCVENNDGFLNRMQLQVKRARLNMVLAILPWLRASAGQAAVDHLNDATRQAMLMNTVPGYDPYGLCPGNPEGLFVGRMMSLKFATCSELVHPFSSASSLDGACMIEEDILCELPALPGFPHPASCATAP